VAARTPGLGAIRLVFDACTRWIVAALSRAGVPAVGVEGVSDLVIGDRKVGGSAIHRSRGLVYFSSTILVAPRVDLMERFLAHPPREPAYRRGRDHASFVGDVSGAAPGLDARTLTRRLAEELTSGAAPLPSSRPR
jgi:lipoate-protein ligase A